MREFEIPKPPPGWYCWGDVIYACEDDPEGLCWDEDIWYALDSDHRVSGVKPGWVLDVGSYGDRRQYTCKVIRFRPVREMFPDPDDAREVVEYNDLSGPEDTLPDWERPYAVDDYETAEEVVAWIGRWFDRLGGRHARG